MSGPVRTTTGRTNLNTATRPTTADLLDRLARLDAIADAASQVVARARHWFPVRGDRLAAAKSTQNQAGVRDVWNAARRLETQLYPPGEGRPASPESVLRLVWPVRWERLITAVEDLLARFDGFLEHLDWLGHPDWLGLFHERRRRRRRRPGTEPGVEAVDPGVLDLLAGSADYLRAVVAEARQVYEAEPSDRTPCPAPRLVFDDTTHTVTLDGEGHHVANPKAYAVYKAIAGRDTTTITKAKIRGKVTGVNEEKTIPNLIKKLPRVLRNTVKVSNNGYWHELPEMRDNH
jgi:hypothetical protein